MSTLTIQVPRDFVLHRDACSYGYFLLAPSVWDVQSRELGVTVDVGSRAVALVAVQETVADRRTRAAIKPGSVKDAVLGAGKGLRVSADVKLNPGERETVRAQLARMLRLDESAEQLAAFHRVDKRLKKHGRGRLVRSATMFEDVIKTVTSCNVAWSSTITMNRRLCEVAGKKSDAGTHAFPTPQALAKVHPMVLRERCRVGYRDKRIIELAQMFADGTIRPEWFEDPRTPDEDVRKALIELPGIGPYAAANIMQLLGRYGHLPLDTESVRHGRTVLGFKGDSPRVMKQVKKHFAPFGEHRFRSYWFELWTLYEHTRGVSWTWERESSSKVFSASGPAK